MKYKKKPLVIEAEQFVVWDKKKAPLSFMAHGVTYPVYKDDQGFYIVIPTLQGILRCNEMDFIIKGAKDDYPCNPDIFEKSYDQL